MKSESFPALSSNVILGVTRWQITVAPSLSTQPACH